MQIKANLTTTAKWGGIHIWMLHLTMAMPQQHFLLLSNNTLHHNLLLLQLSETAWRYGVGTLSPVEWKRTGFDITADVGGGGRTPLSVWQGGGHPPTQTVARLGDRFSVRPEAPS